MSDGISTSEIARSKGCSRFSISGSIIIVIIIIIIITITNNYNNNKDLCTTVSIVLSANSGTFSPVLFCEESSYICRDGIYPL